MLQEGRLLNTVSAKGKNCLGIKGVNTFIVQCSKGDAEVYQYYDNGHIINKKTGQCLSTTKASKGGKVVAKKCNDKDDKQTWTQFLTSGGKFKVESTASGIPAG
jgi:hypothetical protein